ncbi:Serine-threonine protein kinase [Entamoeba marina]
MLYHSWAVLYISFSLSLFMCSTLAFPCGNGCISCVLNTCELCNKSLGYYPSCSGCLPGYYSDGSVCYEITSNPLTCEEYLGKYNSLITINEFAITQTPSTYNLCENLCQFHLPPSVTNTLGDYFRIVPRDSSIYKITTSNEIQISFQTSCDDCFITLPLSSQPYYIYLQNIEYVLFVYGTPSTIISFNATTEIDKTELVFGENTVKGNYYGVTKCTDYQLNGTWYWFNSQDMNYTLTTYGSNPIIVVQTDTKCISISSNSNTTQVMFIGGEMMYIFCTEPVIYLEIGCNDCGNGTCSTKEGHCICPDGLVNKNGTCSTCGNGIVDEDEECEDGEGCIDCKCGEGYKEHNKTCIINLCGNGIINEGEECDGGIGCELCQCKKFYKTVHGVDCKITFIYEITPLATSIIIYIIIYIIILTLTIFKSNQLQKRIASEEKDYFRGGYIPFLKTGSRYVQIDLLHNYATFNPSQIIFNDSTIRPDVDEIARSKFCITNCRRETMNFVLHGHDEYKFDIVFDPPVGTIRGGQTVVVKVKILIRCTSSIRKLLPISLEWTNWKGVKKSMEEEDLFDKTSGEDDTIIESSDDDSDEEVTKKVTKIHTYITLVAESAVSNKLDYEEVQIEQPPIGSGTFGIVYKATWRKVEIAVKVLKLILLQ